MKKSTKGALLSGLVFPGVGQLALKQRKRGLILIVIAGSSLLYVGVRIYDQALATMDQVFSRNGDIDLDTITKASVQASDALGGPMINAATFVIVLCWLFAIYDAWRIGQQQDQQSSHDSPASPPT